MATHGDAQPDRVLKRPRRLPWGHDELAMLIELAAAGLTLREISKQVSDKFGTNRTANACSCQLIRRRGRKEAVVRLSGWGQDDIDIFNAYYSRYGARGVAAVLHHTGKQRTIRSVQNYAHLLRRGLRVPKRKTLWAVDELRARLATDGIVDLEEVATDTKLKLEVLRSAAFKLTKSGRAKKIGFDMIVRSDSTTFD